jgi:ferric-dicitrate binding protein FerR (iron transport regulator)
MKQEKIWELVVLKLSGEATPAQEADLEEALKQNPHLGFSLEILERLWKSNRDKGLTDTEDRFNRHLQRLSNHLSEDTLRYETTAAPPPGNRRGATLYRFAWPAAIAAACCAFAFLVLRNGGEGKKTAVAAAQSQVCTRDGSKSKLQLPDGTEVWLNAGSRITYGDNFAGPVRQVTLEGEAFFEVSASADNPFIIHTKLVDITVLGTALNVRAYAEEKVAETALIRGRVEIKLHSSPEKRIILKPAEKLIVRDDSITLARPLPVMTLTQVHYLNQGRDSAAMETLWLKNKLVFDEEPLQQVAMKLERWYGVKVSILDEQLKNSAYSGVFEDEELTEVLYALQLTGNFHYTIRKKEVIIRP